MNRVRLDMRGAAGILRVMPQRSSKSSKPTKAKPDANEIAAGMARFLAGEAPKPTEPPEREKNPAAVALGKLGGAKGGKARAAKLSPAKRKAIAKKAAAARWGKEP